VPGSERLGAERSGGWPTSGSRERPQAANVGRATTGGAPCLALSRHGLTNCRQLISLSTDFSHHIFHHIFHHNDQ